MNMMLHERTNEFYEKYIALHFFVFGFGRAREQVCHWEGVRFLRWMSVFVRIMLYHKIG
jgi:hypothetical protein